MKSLRIGELAKAAGVSIRTLHHYDEIGLLKPSAVQDTGHRWYSQKDVERLQQIISLKSLGLSLTDIEQCLRSKGFDLQKTLTLQLAAVQEKIADLNQIHQKLRLLTVKLAHNEGITAKELLAFMKEVQAMNMEQYYTPQQLETLRQRLEKFPDEARAVEKAWPELFKKFAQALDAGLSVNDPKVVELAKTAQHYIDLFTGGDPAIEANLDKMYAQNQQNALKVWNVSKEVFDFALAARKQLKK